MRRGDPASFSSRITHQQPCVSRIFDLDLLSRLDRKFTCRVIANHCAFHSFTGEQLDWNPSFAAVRSPAPFPARVLVVLTSNADPLTGCDLDCVRVFDSVLQLYAY